MSLVVAQTEARVIRLMMIVIERKERKKEETRIELLVDHEEEDEEEREREKEGNIIRTSILHCEQLRYQRTYVVQ